MFEKRFRFYSNIRFRTLKANDIEIELKNKKLTTNELKVKPTSPEVFIANKYVL